MRKKYNAAIIGSGPAGHTAAIRLGQLGKSACVIDIDEQRLGGVCLNEGCIPLKALIYAAGLFSLAGRAGDYGIDAALGAPDMEKILASSRRAPLRLQSGLKGLFKKYGIDFISGRARIISPHEIDVVSENGKKRISAEAIIISSGSRPYIPAGAEADGEIILTSADALRLKKVPKTILVAGAGSIGTEFSYIFSSFKSKVTLAEMKADILPSEDAEVSRALAGVFKKRGIDVLTGVKIKSLRAKGGVAEAVFEIDGSEKKAEFERALIAAGRRPNTEDIGLEDIGVKTDGAFIAADKRMRTNIDSVYAAGDVLNTPMYAHTAYQEGILAAEAAAGMRTTPIDYDNTPRAVFCEPQAAGIGMTEAEARSMKYDAAVYRHFFRAGGLAVAVRREDGFIKIVADKKTHKLLGVHIIGADAAEILHEFAVAKNAGLKVEDIARTTHAHPTFSEIAKEAASGVFGRPIYG